MPKAHQTEDYQKYQNNPDGFLREVLGLTLAPDQIRICHAVRDGTRAICKGGHGTAKTHTGAGLGIWFLHAFDPAIVVTTAPSAEQMDTELWQEIRGMVRNARRPLLRGLMPAKSAWQVSPMRYMRSRATNDEKRFRGKHNKNMLFLFEEANGIPEWAWEETENMCTAENNRIFAWFNPTETGGKTFSLFKGESGWATLTLNAMDHPNVLTGQEIYPGAATWGWVDKRVKSLCAPLEEGQEPEQFDFEWPFGSGQWWKPDPVFMCRVLGEFPMEGDDNLISLAWIDRARKNPLPIDPTTPVDLGVDVAYAGGDYCCVFSRRGPSVMDRWKWRGVDPDKAKTKIGEIIKDHTDKGMRVGTVTVDAIGIGSGVAYGLIGMQRDGIIKCGNIIPLQVSEKARESEKFDMKRSELAFGLAERFRTGLIDLSRLKDKADDFESQAVNIRIDRESRSLRQKIVSKDEYRKEHKISPDDFDAMCYTFIDTSDTFAENYVRLLTCA